MKLKKVISLTTALLMTATVAVGIAAPAMADVTYTGHTIAILNSDATSDSIAYTGTAVDANGALAADTTLTLGVYIFNDPGTGGLGLPITFSEFPDGSIKSIGTPTNAIDKGHAYGDQESISNVTAIGQYDNGVNKSLHPESYKQSETEGIKFTIAPNGAKAISPGTADNARRYKDEDDNYILVSKADSNLAQLTFTLAAGTAKGTYRVKFDDSQGGEFIVASDENNVNFKNTISFKGFTVSIGEEAVTPGNPITKPVFTVGTPANAVDGKVIINDTDRARTFLDKAGKEVTSLRKYETGNTIPLTDGFAVVKVPVTVKNGLGAVGLQGKVKISGTDAGKVVLDSADRYAKNDIDEVEQANKSVSAGAIPLNNNSQGAPYVDANDQYEVLVINKNVDEDQAIADNAVIFNLQFLVAINATQDTYSFTVELSDFEWTVAGTPAYAASIDDDGALLPNATGNTKFSLYEAGTVVLAKAAAVTTTTGTGTTTTGTGTTTTGTGTTTTAKGVTTTKSVTTTPKPVVTGGTGGGTTNPPTGDGGVAGVIATIAVVALAGGAAYFAKKKNDEE